LQDYKFEHRVKPKVVYISNPTELGTVYNKDEIKELYSFCQNNDLLLYLDGARLPSALVVEEANISLEDINKYTDAFFLGATKHGAFLGEALILSNDKFKKDFRYLLKQKGAMLAKGRLIGIQFETLLKDSLYLDLAKHAKNLAQYTKCKLQDLNIEFLVDSPTNQIFPILKNEQIEELRKEYDFHEWEKIDSKNTCIRLVFSWATQKYIVDKFLLKIKNLK
jgi:threonine aldolase